MNPNRKFKNNASIIDAVAVILIVFIILFTVFVSMFASKKTEQKLKYRVVSSLNEVVLETNDKLKAYETANNLTMMGRAFSLKSYYFVLEKDSNLNKDF